jgi:hypothetical protein
MSFLMRIKNIILMRSSKESLVDRNEFIVIHPLYDNEEEKCNPDNLKPMTMTRSRKYSLLILRVYLILMICLAVYKVLLLAGAFGRIAP